MCSQSLEFRKGRKMYFLYVFIINKQKEIMFKSKKSSKEKYFCINGIRNSKGG